MKAEMTGKRFGKLTVEEKTELRKNRYTVWKCRCDCGGEILADTRSLTRGAVFDCGCSQRQKKRAGRAEDLSGKVFGELTVLERVPGTKKGTFWKCLCSCGEEKEVSAYNLKAGKVKSCGCLRRKKGQERAVDLTGRRFGRLIALNPTERRSHRLSIYWHCRCDCGNELEVTEENLAMGNCKSCGCLRQETWDEIPNRLHRIDGTCIEWLEKRKHRNDNTSGFRGVYPVKNGKYRVIIGFKRKKYYVGTYDSFQEAKDARLDAEKQIHEGFVQAYYEWEELKESGQLENTAPLIFEVEKVDGGFCILTNTGTMSQVQATL